MEVEQEINRLKNFALKTEEEKMHLERKSREAESLTARLGKYFNIDIYCLDFICIFYS